MYLMADWLYYNNLMFSNINLLLLQVWVDKAGL